MDVQMNDKKETGNTVAKKGKRIIIAGGGTGGHIFPAIAIAHALKKKEPAVDILFIGAKGKMEMEKVPQAGYRIEGLNIAGFNRSSLIKNAGLPLKLLKSWWKTRKIFSRFKPDAVIGVGGYSSYTVLQVAQAKGIKNFIHESNSFAGKVNIIRAKKATKVFTGSDGMEKFFPAEKIMVTGNPVRAAITAAAVSREEGLSFFGLHPDGGSTLLVVGGSLGARSVNHVIAGGLQQLTDAGIQLIWQTGKDFLHTAKDKTAGLTGIWAGDFITKMEYAYAAADMVVARAGAMTVAELCVAAKPVLFVPYPHAAEDHQTANAMQLVQKNAALMIRDHELAEKLLPAIITLAADEARRKELMKNISQLAITDADTRIAEEILKTI